MHLPKSNKKAFTLVELLIVILIISTLAAIVYVSLNPSQRIKSSKDVKRAAEINSILMAVNDSIIDNKGALPAGLTTSMAETQLGTSATGCAVATGGCAVVTAACLDLTTPLAKYFKTMPVDQDATAAKTGYSIAVDANNIVTVKACLSEGGTNLSISR